MVYFKYQNKPYTLRCDYFKKCSLKKLFPDIDSYEYEYNVGDIVNDKLILEQIKYDVSKQLIRGYRIKCLNCNKESTVTVYNINKNKSCKHCAWITQPLVCEVRKDLKQYFQEKDLNYYYSSTLGSNVKLNFVCPHCGFIKTNKTTIANLVKHGFKCNICSDKIPMGEKYFENLLKQLNLCYERQFSFSESICVNEHQYFPVYDFVLHKERLIIEIDGVQHNMCDWNTHIGLSIPETDELKDKYARQHGYDIIRIPYKSYKFDKFKYEIHNKLGCIFDLSLVDFLECKKASTNSRIIEVINLWNSGMSLTEINEQTKLNKWTLIDYLHTGVDLKLCKYTTSESMSRSQKYRLKQRKQENHKRVNFNEENIA